MTQEEKNLLLKDLCARLMHDVEVQIANNIEGESNPFYVNKPLTFVDVDAFIKNDVVIDIKPYLRPMSSMTLKEESELCKILECDSINVTYAYVNWSVGGSCDVYDMDIDFKTFGIVVEWLNAHHFDYRGLIKMGLALEAPKGMYNN